MNDGGPAFPGTVPKAYRQDFQFASGMSLRDYFAAAVESPTEDEIHRACKALFGCSFACAEHWQIWQAEAFVRYRKSDYMLAERSKKGGDK